MVLLDLWISLLTNKRYKDKQLLFEFCEKKTLDAVDLSEYLDIKRGLFMFRFVSAEYHL